MAHSSSAPQWHLQQQQQQQWQQWQQQSQLWLQQPQLQRQMHGGTMMGLSLPLQQQVCLALS